MHELEGVAPRQIASLDVSPSQHGLPAMSVLQRPSIGTQLDDEPPVPPVAGMHMFVSGRSSNRSNR
jgi:hypothetical protein